MAARTKIYRGLSWAFGTAPPRVLSASAWLLAFVSYRILHIRRAVTLQNLAIALIGSSAETKRHVAFAAVKSFFLTTLETMGAGVHDLSRTVTIRGQENIKPILAEGKGCLILCLHMGNWEALASAVSRQVAPTHVVVKKVGTSAMDGFAAWLRRTSGYDAIKNDGSGATYRQIARALKRNEIVGFVMDQYQPGAPLLPCFGVPVKTNTGLATIWRRTGVPIVPLTIRRVGVHRHVAEAWPALQLTRTGDATHDILAATAVFNRVMEQMILGNPEQYFWLHDRWKWKRRTQGQRLAAQL